MLRRAACAALLITAAVTVIQTAPVNLTGTWAFKYWTVKIRLQQDGDRVWGVGGAADFWFRGHWDGARLLLVVNNFEERRKGACTPRGVFLLKGSTVNNVIAHWRRPGEKPLNGPWTRLSPDAGEPIEYPYAMELDYCGSLVTYELAFPTGSDALTGTDWPILTAIAQVLKDRPSVKIQIAGHTDATGDAAANQALSERRAEAVKQVLVERYGADGSRISTRGWGAEQAIEENTTEEGRALNRRVEIIASR
jgi:outer membrane protein OmpA-like peptidoglycan-associated protein